VESLGSFKTILPGLETTEVYERYMSNALIGCLADMPDLRVIGNAQCPHETHWLVMTYIP
jgi:hypothetical protein